MVAPLSQDWLDLRCRLAADLPERPGASARIQHVVIGAPEGELRYVDVIDDGRLVACTLGGDEAADVTVTVSYEDELAMARGERDLPALFMQGRAKLVGDMRAFLAVQPVTQSAALAAAGAALAAQTD